VDPGFNGDAQSDVFRKIYMVDATRQRRLCDKLWLWLLSDIVTIAQWIRRIRSAAVYRHNNRLKRAQGMCR